MSETDKKLYDFLSGESQNNSLTSQSVLDSLKTISYFEKEKAKLQDTDEEPGWLKMYNQEIRYINAGIDALTQDPLLASKMGKDFGSAMRVAGILKTINAEKEAKEWLGKYVPDDSSLNKKLGTPAVQGGNLG